MSLPHKFISPGSGIYAADWIRELRKADYAAAQDEAAITSG